MRTITQYTIDQLIAAGSYEVPVDPKEAGKYGWYQEPEGTAMRRLLPEELQLIIDHCAHDPNVAEMTDGTRQLDGAPFSDKAFTVCTPGNRHKECIFLIVDGDYLEAGNENCAIYQKKDGKWVFTHYASGTEGFICEATDEDRARVTYLS